MSLDNFITKYKGKNLWIPLEKIPFFFFQCLLFLICFAPGQVFTLFVLLLFIASFLAYGNLFKLKDYQSSPLIWLVIYFLIHILWLLGTKNLTLGISDVERHISFILFPLTIPIIIKNISNEKLLFGYKLYVISCFGVSIAALSIAIFKNYQINGLQEYYAEYFTNHNILLFLGLHATYFSLNIMIACILIIHILNQQNINKSFEKILYLIALTIFLLMLYLLQARIIILAACIIVIIIPFFSHSKKIKRIAIIFLCALFLVVLNAFFFDLSFRDRALQPLNIDFNQLMGTNAENGVTQRIFFWQRSIDVIQESPWLGHGTGDMLEALTLSINNYLERQDLSPTSRTAIEWLIQNPHNPHNQFLTDAIKFGLPGLIVGLIFLGYGLSTAIRKRDLLLLSLTILFALSCLTESMFVRQKGIDLFTLLFVTFTSTLKENDS